MNNSYAITPGQCSEDETSAQINQSYTSGRNAAHLRRKNMSSVKNSPRKKSLE
jgi:hypothetical protein